MELFDVLPEHFFGLLAGKCRRIYAEAGLCLYEQYRLAQFGIEQEILRDKFQELIESWAEAGVAYEDESFSEKDAADESRAKANHMIRRMKEFGWLDYEQRENFKIFILLPHYSSRLWGLFANLCEGRAVEYQRFAFMTYQVLSGEAAKVQPSMAVLEAERLAEEFVEELRILLNNIKNKMEQVSAQTSLQDVLSHHFVEYRADIVDRSYHRLKTSDHVSRYRIGILREVQEIQQNKERMRALCDDAVRRQLADSVEAAEYRMNASLQTIEEIYRGLDDMFAQIDRRHNQYVRASYERALIDSHRRLQQSLLREAERIAALAAYPAGEFYALPEGAAASLGELSQMLVRAAGDDVQAEEIGQLQGDLRNGGTLLAEIGAGMQRGALLLQQEQTAARARQEELRAEIEGLKRRQRKYRPEMTRLKELLEQRLAGRSGVYVLCEELEILDEEWRDTLEGYLNTQRFDLLVDESVFREALHIYETEKKQRHFDGVGLVNTEAEKKYLGEREHNSLASLLQAKNPLAQARVDHLLGTVMQAADEQEMITYRSAATKSCMSYKGLVARQIPRRFYEIPYIGAGAIERQLEIRQRELEEVQQRLAVLAEEARRMQTCADLLHEPLHRYGDFAEQLGVLSELEACAAELARMAEELSSMDLSEAARLKAAYEESRQRAEEAARACSETTKEQARAESALDQAERALPLLARAEEESGQAVRAWRDAYPELSEAAEARLAALMQEAHGERSMEERLQSYDSSRRGNETRRDNMWQQLLVAR